MDFSQKASVDGWKAVLAQYLSPVTAIEDLPEFFPVDSRSRSQVLAKEDQPHEAVDILLEVIKCSEVSDAYSRLLEAVRKQHPWLIPIITGEIDDDSLPCGTSKFQFQEYVNKFLTLFLPTLVEGIIARDISMYLKSQGILNQEEDERVEAKTTNSGNTAAVRFLFSILVRKPIEWLQAFKDSIRDQNYSDHIMDIVSDIPDDIERFSEISASKRVGMENRPALHLHSSAHGHTRVFVEEGNFERKYEASSMATSTLASLKREQSRYFDGCDCDVASSMPQPAPGCTPDAKSQFSLDKTLIEDLHGTVQSESPVSSPANNIIPKEAGYIPRKSKAKMPLPTKTMVRTLSKQAITGDNVIIVAEDRLEIAWNIIIMRFPHILDSTDRKIGFLVPQLTNNYDTLKNIFVSQQWSVAFFRNKSYGGIRKLMQESQVIVLTAKSFVDWLNEDSDVHKIAEFDILIFDQCFKSCQNGPYKEVLLKYLAVGQNRRGDFHTQVIGLANSMSSIRLSAQNQPDDIVLDLISLFDAKGGIETHLQTASRPNLKSNSSSKKSVARSKKSELSDPFSFYLCENVDDIVDLLYRLPVRHIRNLQHPRKIPKGTSEYLKWCDDLLEKSSDLEDDSFRYHVTNCAKFLHLFNAGILIKNTCKASNSSHFLKENIKNILPVHAGLNYETVEKRLMKIADDTLEKLNSLLLHVDTEDSCGLEKIEKEIFDQCKRKPASQILILVCEKVIVDYLNEWLKEDVLTVLIQPRNRATRKSSKKFPNAIVRHHSDKMDKVQQYDMIIRYDCPVTYQDQGKSKCLRQVDIQCESILADNKMKISKMLLMHRAIEKAESLRNMDGVTYLNQIEKRQAKLLSRQPT